MEEKNVNTGQESSCITPVLHCADGFREQEEHLFGNWLCLSPNAGTGERGRLRTASTPRASSHTWMA